MRKSQAAGIVLSAILFSYILSPYISVFNLYVALASSDREAVDKRVLWEPVRKELRVDLDRFAQSQANRLLDKEGVKISWDSASFSEEMTAKIATPEGLIYLFHHPVQVVEKLRQMFDKPKEAALLNPQPEKKDFKPEAPNIGQLLERLQYAFFTGNSSFRLSFKIGDRAFSILLERYGFSWKIVSVKLPV